MVVTLNIQKSNFFNLKKAEKQEAAKKTEKSETTEKSKSDKVDIKSDKESFEKIYAEMQTNIPDRTSTIEEKELAIEYIDRILKSDANDEIKGYWSQKKIEIQGEIARIKAEQGSTSNMPEFEKLYAEMSANVPDSTTTIEEKNLVLEYIQKIMDSDATPNIKKYWQGQADTIRSEINQMKKAEKNSNSEKKSNTVDNSNQPKYYEIISEMRKYVPAPAETLEEKELAMEYIEKLLDTDDISTRDKDNWTRTAKELSKEIETMKNERLQKQKSFDELWEKIQEYSSSSLKKPEEKDALNNILSGIISSNNVNSFEKLYWQNKLQTA